MHFTNQFLSVRVRTLSSKDVAQTASFGLGSDWTNRDILIQNMKVGTGIQARRSLGNLGSILVRTNTIEI